jgi:hypothetical protein
MGLVDEIYGPADAEATPPETERWAFYVARGIQPVCTFIRRRDRDLWGPPRLVVAYPDARPPVPPDPMILWDPWVEDWLLAHHVAAATAANEAERIGFDLCARFGELEKRSGTATFTAVLLRYLYDHGCSLYIPLERKLGAIRAYEPDSAHASTTTCEAIAAIVRDVRAAIDGLGYPAAVATEIRRDALAYYLHDRFGVCTSEA